MSEKMLHFRAPGRWDSIASIVGDRNALETLRRAVDAALATGAGGAALFNSDGESYALAVALEDNMCNVLTAYAEEATAVRSLREIVPMHDVENFSAALCKARRIREELDLAPIQAAPEMERQAPCGTIARQLGTMNSSGPTTR